MILRKEIEKFVEELQKSGAIDNSHEIKLVQASMLKVCNLLKISADVETEKQI